MQIANAGGQNSASWWPVILVILTIGSGISAAVVICWKFRRKMRFRRQAIYSSAEKMAVRRLKDDEESSMDGDDADDEGGDTRTSSEQSLFISQAPEFRAAVAEANKEPFRRMMAALSDCNPAGFLLLGGPNLGESGLRRAGVSNAGLPRHFC